MPRPKPIRSPKIPLKANQLKKFFCSSCKCSSCQAHKIKWVYEHILDKIVESDTELSLTDEEMLIDNVN